MKWMQTIKLQTKIMIIVVLFMVFLVSGISYAFYLKVNSNTDDQVVTTGSLDITYSSTNGYINNNNYSDLVPMSDTVGLGVDGYVFSVKNNGTLPVNYKVYLYIDYASYENDVNNSVISGDIFESLNNIAYNIKTNDIENNTIKKLGTITNTSSINLNSNHPNVTKYEIYSGKITTANGVDNHVLKLWLDEDTDESDIGKYIYLKLEVEMTVDED